MCQIDRKTILIEIQDKFGYYIVTVNRSIIKMHEKENDRKCEQSGYHNEYIGNGNKKQPHTYQK